MNELDEKEFDDLISDLNVSLLGEIEIKSKIKRLIKLAIKPYYEMAKLCEELDKKYKEQIDSLKKGVVVELEDGVIKKVPIKNIYIETER